MLIKLLKYDLKYMLKNMIIFYILSIFFAVLTRILFAIDNSTIIMIISKISEGCLIAILVNVLINTLMRSWVRFKDSVYGDEAYLTHTLPVTKNEIYSSKMLQTLIFLIVSFVVIVISLFITYYTNERWLLLKEFVNNFTASINFNTALFVISFLLIIFLEIFNALQCGYLGILLGYRKNNNKTGFSVLFGVIAYLISQSIVLLCVFLAGLFDSHIMDLFKNNIQLSPDSFKLFVILAIILYIIIIVLMSIICKKIFNKGVNIE